MKIKLIRGLLALLCLLPATIGAQSLSRYEYWFDDDYASRQSGTLSGNDNVINKAIPTTGLDYGVHRFNLRVRRSDNMYSAVTSQLFLKLDRGTSNTVEYWFDDNIDNCSTIPLPAFDEDCDLTLDLADAVNFPLGFHKLNMRVTTAGGGLSAVYTSDVLKLAGGVATQLEYWFDDDIAHSQRLDGSLASTGDAYIYNTNLDLTALPVGLHRLNYRAVCPDSDLKSAVMTQKVMKLPSGKIQYVEYWVDGNIGSRKRVTPNSTSSNTDIVFNRTADLGTTNAGAHRLYMRGVSADRKMSTAITSMPVIVKSQYSNMNPADVTMKRYSVSVDNEEPVTVKFGTPDFDVTLDRDVDLHDLSTGTHTLKTKFWNSFGAGVGLEQQFTIKEPETPVINLSVTEKDGIVLLRYDIPANQKNYRLQRKDANGAKHTIFRDEVFRGWEVSDWWNDTPEAGSYTYYVESVYYDSEGNHHLLKSNEVSVNIAKAQEDLNNCGYITGRIVPTYGAADFHDIVFSDGVKTRTSNNFFERQMIPVGTTLTISVIGNSREEFETATITIKPGENHVKLKDLNNTEFVSKPNNYYSDLDFSSDLEWVGNSYQFSVRNTTRNTWSGYVRLRIISKDKAQKEKDSETTDPTEEEEYDEITPGLRAEDNYVYVFSEEIKNLQSGQSTIVSLSLDDVFAPDKNDRYYIYFESIGKWNSDPKGSEKVKIIGIDRDYSITENPMLRQVTKKDLKMALEKERWQDAEYAANIILACCSKLNQLNGIIGNLGDIGWVELSKVYREKYPLDLNKLNQYIGEAIETESTTEFREDQVMQNFLFYVFGYNSLDFANTFREKIANDIFKYSKGVEDYLGGAMKVLKYIRDYREWESMDDYERYFYCADAILDVTDRYTNTPLCKMFKTYIKVGKSLIQKALEYGATLYDNYAGSMLKDNAALPGEHYDYNRNIDFKIMVRTNSKMNLFSDRYFNFEENGTSPIREVVVKAHNIPGRPGSIATFYFDPVPVSDGVMLKQMGSCDDESMLDENRLIDRMWMEIKWKNGRTTKIPLRDDIDGVVFKQATAGQLTHLYTVYLQSETTTFDNMADNIEIKE